MDWAIVRGAARKPLRAARPTCRVSNHCLLAAYTSLPDQAQIDLLARDAGLGRAGRSRWP